jgi:uncharacterized membrane protein
VKGANAKAARAKSASTRATTRSTSKSGGGSGRAKASAKGKATRAGAKPSRATDATKNVAAKTKDVASKTTKTASRLKDAAEEVPKPNKLARKLAMLALKRTARKVAQATAEAGRAVAEKAALAGGERVGEVLKHRLPIQRSLDVAVPILVAWDEWMTFERLPEGVHAIVDIERDGDRLYGHIAGPRGGDWEADILDVREDESFAWKSDTGTDCAGLVTFHRLSERLTRVELNLDVLATNVPEAGQLLLRIADRRAQSELHRFKARVEMISPDVYEEEVGSEDEQRAVDEARAVEEALRELQAEHSDDRDEPDDQPEDWDDDEEDAADDGDFDEADDDEPDSGPDDEREAA